MLSRNLYRRPTILRQASICTGKRSKGASSLRASENTEKETLRVRSLALLGYIGNRSTAKVRRASRIFSSPPSGVLSLPRAAFGFAVIGSGVCCTTRTRKNARALYAAWSARSVPLPPVFPTLKRVMSPQRRGPSRGYACYDQVWTGRCAGRCAGYRLVVPTGRAPDRSGCARLANPGIHTRRKQDNTQGKGNTRL